jgi:endonuclease YncB( thermonuclease family)
MLVVLIAARAHADPCRAIPDRGPLPTYLHSGALFSGPVVYVGDGDSLCVDVGKGQHSSTGAAWVEVRLADFYAIELGKLGGPEARAMLIKVAKGRRVTCVAGRRSYDRIVARCALRGVSLGELMRGAGMGEGGRGR